MLLLAALGLAITYGLLGVINMAHGEMLMIGAYAAGWYSRRWRSSRRNGWPLSAGRAAGGVSGDRRDRHGAGAHHYSSSVWSAAGNAARHGISLMLIQLVRMLFGAQNVEVATGRLSGGVQVLPNLILPWNRLAVLAFVLLVLCFTAHPEPHPSGDERPRRDAEPGDGRLLRRAYRAGGYAGLWPRLRYCRAGRRGAVAAGNVGPELGQGYIIDSFLVVVLGGVGQLAGSVAAAFGLGIFNKILEPQMGAVLGKILIR